MKKLSLEIGVVFLVSILLLGICTSALSCRLYLLRYVFIRRSVFFPYYIVVLTQGFVNFPLTIAGFAVCLSRL